MIPLFGVLLTAVSALKWAKAKSTLFLFLFFFVYTVLTFLILCSDSKINSRFLLFPNVYFEMASLAISKIWLTCFLISVSFISFVDTPETATFFFLSIN